MLLHFLQLRWNLNLQVFDLLYEVRVALFKRLNVVRLMGAIYYTLWAYRVTSARETVVAHNLVIMSITHCLVGTRYWSRGDRVWWAQVILSVLQCWLILVAASCVVNVRVWLGFVLLLIYRLSRFVTNELTYFAANFGRPICLVVLASVLCSISFRGRL